MVSGEREAVVVDLSLVDDDEDGGRGGGVVWSLPDDGDLNANKVRLDAGHVIAGHVNDEVDVALLVLDGDGQLAVGGDTDQLAPGVFALVPKGSHRAITAGPTGVTYLSIHRRRGPLTIGQRTR